MSILELIAVAISILGIWLTARRNRLCWPIVLLSTVLYGVIFARSKLYSDMLLQGLFGIFTLYGWWNWSREADEDGGVRVGRIPRSELLSGLAAGALGSLLLGALMARFTDAAIPHVDSTLSSFSLVAQLWTSRRYIENWWLWIVVNVAYTAVFIYKHLYLTSGLYAVLIVLAVIGLRRWRSSITRQESSRDDSAITLESADLA